RAGGRQAVAGQNRPAVEGVEQVSGDLHRRIASQLDVVGETEIGIPQVGVALVVQGRNRERFGPTDDTAAADAQGHREDVALPPEDAGPDLEVGGQLVERVEDELPAGVEEDVALAGSSRLRSDLSAVHLRPG